MNSTEQNQEPDDSIDPGGPISIAIRDTSKTAFRQAPAERTFPEVPAAWYLFGSARELRQNPLTKRILGKDLVAYRGEHGLVVVMDARCSHLAADLGCGQVKGENIQCPFHQWEYGMSGECVSIPGVKDIPAFARQTVYPTEERHGFIYFFNGEQPLFELPFFEGVASQDLVPGKPFHFVAECSWHMLAANGFDTAHFTSVHDRTLVSAPIVDSFSNFSRRMRFRSMITGNSIFDYLLVHTVGDGVDISITCWGGPMTLVTGSFRRAKSYIFITTQPLENHKTNVEVIVFSTKKRLGARRLIPRWVELSVRRLFTKGFMKDDIDRLGGIRYQPASLLENEGELIQFFEWVASLPQVRR